MLSSLLSSSQQHIRKRCADCIIISRRNITSAQKRALQVKKSNQPTANTHVGLKNNIPKAPHMQSQVFESTAAGKKTGVLDTLQANPLIFAIFVFPTVMMGIALIVRPDFRAQILGTESGDDGKTKMRTNASITVPKNAPEPVYEVETSGVAIAANEVEATKNYKEEEGASQQSTMTNNNNQQQSDKVLTGNTNETEGGKTRDLIYALGIRPHTSLD